jgi:predicted acyl esterase
MTMKLFDELVGAGSKGSTGGNRKSIRNTRPEKPFRAPVLWVILLLGLALPLWLVPHTAASGQSAPNPEWVRKLEAFLKQADANGDGLDAAERIKLESLISRRYGQQHLGRVRRTLDRADSDGDGRITRTEWDRYRQSLSVLWSKSARAGTITKKTCMVPMSDGIKLATDVYLPPGEGPFPVILARTPYNKKMKRTPRTARQGYAFVIQDMRGRFASEGENLPFIGCGWAPHRDGAETVAWIRKQPWCNGKIGTVGGSAGGITQNLLAGANPEGLVAQYIQVAAASLYHHAAYVGGALRRSQVVRWLKGNRFDPKALRLYKTHPLYDKFWQRLDSTRKHEVMSVPAVHVGGWFDTFSQGTIDSFVGRQYHGGKGARGRQKLVMGPWAHGIGRTKVGELRFPDGKFPRKYRSLRWFDRHLKGKKNGIMVEPAVAYYVMGDVNDPDAPGNEWRYADGWPIPATPTPYYFHAGGLLSTEAPKAWERKTALKGKAASAGKAASTGKTAAEGKTAARETGGQKTPGKRKGAARGPNPARLLFAEYTFDPENPCPTVGGRNLTLPKGPMNQNRIESRSDILNFTTPPLKRPVEVTGRIAATVFMASSAVDTDLSVRFCDVYPGGESYLMAEGMLRLRLRDSIEVESLLAPGKIYEVTVDCWCTSVIVNRGHRIRVTVTSSNFPRFDRNPGTGKVWRAGCPSVRQANRIYCDPKYPSRILLPVVKSKTTF